MNNPTILAYPHNLARGLCTRATFCRPGSFEPQYPPLHPALGGTRREVSYFTPPDFFHALLHYTTKLEPISNKERPKNETFAPRRASALPASVPPRRLGGLRRSPSPRFPFPFFLKNARVFFKSVMEKRRLGKDKEKKKKTVWFRPHGSISLCAVTKQDNPRPSGLGHSR